MIDRELIARGVNLAKLIEKHGGWIDENNREMIRFPTPKALTAFIRELDERRKAIRS